MSSQYRLDFIWASHGQQLRADLERSVGSLSRSRSELRRHGTEMGRWQQQMRAIGTTIRYAIAGGTVYAVAAAVSRLGELEAKLGEIDSLAARLDERGNLIGLGKQLDEVGDFALATSDKFGIAANDITQHMSRFYSSFDVPEGRRSIQQLKGFTEEMANMALLAEGADPQALAGGIAGMIRGIPGYSNEKTDIAKEAQRFTDIIAKITSLSPVITGVDIARDVGRLGAAQTAMNMTPEQIFAVYGAASFKGGSPAVIGRGITQLLSSELLKPQTDDQKQAFREMGLPSDPNALRQMGGWNVLQQMLTRVMAGTNIRDPAALRNEALTDEEALIAAGATGPNVTLASKAFGRLESLRQFLNLMSVGGVETLKDFIDSIEEAKDVNLGKQRVDLIIDRRYMQMATQRQSNLTTQITRGFRPVFETYSRGIGAIGRLARENPTETTAALVGGTGTLIGARLLRGMATRGRFGALGRGKLGRILSGANTLSDTALMTGMAAEAAPALLSGAQGIGSRASPMWVYIHPLSWQMPGTPQGGAITGPVGGPIVAGGKSKGRGGVPGFIPTALGAIATMPLWMSGDVAESDKQARWRSILERNPKFKSFLENNKKIRTVPQDEYGNILGTLTKGDITTTQARSLLLSRARQPGVRGEGPTFEGLREALLALSAGETMLTLKLEPVGDLSRLFKTTEAKVPVKLWNAGGGRRAPFRGRPKTIRGGD